MGKSRKVGGPRVYSYIRFSTPEQKLGDSERRQIDMAREWAEKKGLAFDEVLNDFGFSAFYGTNKEKGALGVFLERVSKGEICEGSVIVVEDIDRLSRQEPIDAIETLLFGLIKKGIGIQTVGKYPITYDRESLKTSPHLIHFLIQQIQLAHQESLKKSERITEARDKARKLAREQGKPITSRAPAWLKINEDRSGFELIKPAAKAITLIFQMRRKGFGPGRITKKLNESSPWTPPKNPKRKTEGWRGSYIKKILINRSVIGEYQPHAGRKKNRKPVGEPIKGYYPPAVSPELFNAVQSLIEGNNKKNSGRTGEVKNLFGQMAVCAYCGGPMHPDNKGRRSARRLHCYNGIRNVKCQPFAMRYDEIEALVLENCKRLRVDAVLPSNKEQEEECLSLRERIAAKRVELSKVERELPLLVAKFADPEITEEKRSLFDKQIDLRQARAASLLKEIGADEAQLRVAENGRQAFEAWQRDFATMQTAIVSNPDMRLRLKAHLRQLIDKIEVFTNGFAKLADGEEPLLKLPAREHKGRRFTIPGAGSKANRRQAEESPDHIRQLMLELDPKFARSDEGRAFLADLERRMLSKDARFLRIWFKSGALMDVVPPDSIARGVRLVRDKRGETMQYVSPSLEQLLLEFRSKRRRTSSRG